MSRICRWLPLFLLVLFVAGCSGGGGGSAQAPQTPTTSSETARLATGGETAPPELTDEVRLLGKVAPLAVNSTVTQFAVSPSSKSMVIGQVFEVHALAYYPGGTWADVCGATTWSSLNPSVATINPGGFITAHANGTVQIKAVYQYQSSTSGNWQTRTAFCVVTVGSPANMTSLVVSPSSATKPLGLQQQFTARAYYSNGTSLDATAGSTWTSTAGASVDAGGLATATAVGTSTITATFNGSSASAPLTVTAAELVSIEVTPSNPASLPLGFTQQFTATGIYTDNTQQDITGQVAWSSSNTAAVQVDSAGLATSHSLGSATVTATANGVSGSTLAPLEVTPAKLVSLTLSPQNATVGVTQQQAFTATGNFSDGTTQDLTSTVTWTSSDTTVATVGLGADGGVAQTLKAGTVTITALDPDPSNPVSTSTSLTVTPATVVSLTASPAGVSLVEGETQQYKAVALMSDGTTEDLTADPSITWTSSFPSLISISNDPGTQGLATALLAGDGTINAIHVDGKTSSVAVTITPKVTLASLSIAPASRTMRVGETLQYTATGTFTDGTVVDMTDSPDILFTSSFPDAGYTSVSNAPGTKGLVTALAPGDDTINAIYKNFVKTSSTALTVLPPVTVKHIILTPASRTIKVGESLQYTATAILTDDTVVDYTNHPDVWFSSKYPAAGYTIQSNEPGSKGLVTGVAPGNDEIWARHLPTGRVGGTALTVVPGVTLQSLSVSPAGITLREGDTRQYKVMGNYSDGTSRDMTDDPDITWHTSFPDIASVSNEPGSKGLVTALKAGSGTISAISATASPWPANSVALNVVPGLSKTIERVNVTSAELQADGSYDNDDAMVSGDGSAVVFSSRAGNLVPNDTNGKSDIFLRERETGTTILVSQGLGGVPANGDSRECGISGNGRYVVFQSNASNLVVGGQARRDVYRYDRNTGVTERVAVVNGVAANGECFAGARAQMSHDGQVVAFWSVASNLVPGVSGFQGYLRDFTTNSIERYNVVGTFAGHPSVSGDGKFVAYVASYTDGTVSNQHIFLYERATQQALRCTRSITTAPVNGYSSQPVASFDGRYVLYVSSASNLTSGDSTDQNTFRFDRTTLTNVEVDGNGTSTNGSSAMSADGRYVAYSCSYTPFPSTLNLPNGNVWVKDMVTNTYRQVSLTSTGAQSNGMSFFPWISANGRFISFTSTSTDLVPGDTNNTQPLNYSDAHDVFVTGNPFTN